MCSHVPGSRLKASGNPTRVLAPRIRELGIKFQKHAKRNNLTQKQKHKTRECVLKRRTENGAQNFYRARDRRVEEWKREREREGTGKGARKDQGNAAATEVKLLLALLPAGQQEEKREIPSQKPTRKRGKSKPRLESCIRLKFN